jgi:hypothetical protein
LHGGGVEICGVVNVRLKARSRKLECRVIGSSSDFLECGALSEYDQALVLTIKTVHSCFMLVNFPKQTHVIKKQKNLH